MVKRKRKQKMNPWVVISIIIVAILVVNNYTSSSSRESSPVQITARYYDSDGNLIGTSGRGFSIQSIVSPGIEDVPPEAASVQLVASVTNTGNTITDYEVSSIDFEGQQFTSITGSTAVPVGAETQFTTELIDVEEFVGDSQININIEGSLGADLVSDTYSWRFSKLAESLGFFGLLQSFLSPGDESVIIYDDFDSYPTGNFGGGSKWTFVEYLGPDRGFGIVTVVDPKISSSNNAGGSGKELDLYVEDDGVAGPYGPTLNAYSTSLLPNRHTFFKYKLGAPVAYCRQYDYEISFGNDVDGYEMVFSTDDGGSACGTGEDFRRDAENTVSIIAQGSNNYDLFHAGKTIQSSVSYTQDPQLKFFVRVHMDRSEGISLYVDDVRQSVEVVE